MKTRLLKQWERLRASFWFLPAVMAAAATGLALATVSLDRVAGGWWLGAWIYSGGAEGASQLLGAVAGSMITIAGTVFSMTLVALSLASSQLGPRLLRLFMRDTTNQVVLGTFVSTFVYCLLVLRTIRRGDEGEFVPHLSVTTGVVLALLSLAVLILFIHHVSVSIQADHVVARVGRELIEGIDRLFPEGTHEPLHAAAPAGARLAGAPVVAATDGYLQLIDEDALLKLAVEEDLLLLVQAKPGEYVVKGQALLRVVPPASARAALEKPLCAAFLLGGERSPAQDIELLVVQLVEIAVRALSPGINDPFTAVACLDRLASGLSRLVTRDMAPLSRLDAQGRLRVCAPRSTLAGVLDAAFDPIRQSSNGNLAVLTRMLEAIATIARFTRQADGREALRRHAERVARAGDAALPEASDRLALQRCFDAAMQACEAPPAPAHPAGG